jgi:hypothetical protein
VHGIPSFETTSDCRFNRTLHRRLCDCLLYGPGGVAGILGMVRGSVRSQPGQFRNTIRISCGLAGRSCRVPQQSNVIATLGRRRTLQLQQDVSIPRRKGTEYCDLEFRTIRSDCHSGCHQTKIMTNGFNARDTIPVRCDIFEYRVVSTRCSLGIDGVWCIYARELICKHSLNRQRSFLMCFQLSCQDMSDLMLYREWIHFWLGTPDEYLESSAIGEHHTFLYGRATLQQETIQGSQGLGFRNEKVPAVAQDGIFPSPEVHDGFRKFDGLCRAGLRNWPLE